MSSHLPLLSLSSCVGVTARRSGLTSPGTSICFGAGAVEIAVCAAPARGAFPAHLITPEDESEHIRGAGQASRRIHNILMEDGGAGSLLVTEIQSPPGNWSSYPPHKHDTQDPPRESYLEEIYFYRFAKPTGFAFQRVYSADGTLDEVLTARDGDVVLVPRGYHVVAAAPGYDCYYLNVMAGPTREWRFTVDPDHEWLMDWDPNKPKT